MSPANLEKYTHEVDTILRTVPPVEICGQPGDVCLWHHRMMHSGGVNRTIERSDAEGGPVVRMIVPCDFQRDGLSLIEDEESNPGPNYQWWVHTRQFKEDCFREDMWEDWA